MSALKKLLVPVDFSDHSRHVLERACQLAQIAGASVDVLHTWETPSYVSPTAAVRVRSDGATECLETVVMEEARKQMDAFLGDTARSAGVHLSTRIEFGSAAEVIVKVAKDYDLVVIGTEGRSGLAKLIVGSVAQRVVALSPVPVLTINKIAAS